MGIRGTDRDGDKGIGMGTRGGTDRDGMGTRGTDRDGDKGIGMGTRGTNRDGDKGQA